MSKTNDTKITRDELVELVDLLLHSIRNNRFRELASKFENDESLDEVIYKAHANDTERLVVEG